MRVGLRVRVNVRVRVRFRVRDKANLRWLKVRAHKVSGH